MEASSAGAAFPVSVRLHDSTAVATIGIMNRALVLLLMVPIPAIGQSLSEEQRQATVDWLIARQTPDGGFAASAAASAQANLAATTQALRALRIFGGVPLDKKPVQRFVWDKCYNPASGGFAPAPSVLPDVRSTAIGVMAAVELGDPVPAQARVYLQKASTFEEIRLAAAALEALKVDPAREPQVNQWTQEAKATRNSDGTYGQGQQQARETASRIVTIFRFGGSIDHREAVVAALRAGQRSDGGWGDAGNVSDLDSTYRVMRAFAMLKETPEREKCRAFVAKCRNSDGGYGIRPGQPSSVAGCYYAGSVLNWIVVSEK
jgi:prenyltransferase beta subunit